MTTSDATRVLCEHADRCAGCPLINLPYHAQLTHKYERVFEAFGRYPALETYPIEPVLQANPIVHYRTRAKLVVAPHGLESSSTITIGLYAIHGDHIVVDTPHCRVVSPAITEVLNELRRLANQPGHILGRLSVVTPGQCLVRSIDVREARNVKTKQIQLLLTWVSLREEIKNSLILEELRLAAEQLQACLPQVVGVALNLREGDSPQMLGNELFMLRGEAFVPDSIGDVTHFATFGAFVQAHRNQAYRVHELLADRLGIWPGCRVLDLYGGSGAIGLSLAQKGVNIHLIESFAPAAKLALESSRQLSKTAGSFEVTAAEVSTWLSKRNSMQRSPHEPGYDFVIVNPPRRGVAPQVREDIARLNPEAIGYVSCDPDTLARDIDHWVRLGYAPILIQPLDMIPLTEEVETVVILRRRSVLPPRIAYADDEVVIVEKSPHEPTTPQGEYSNSLLQRVRRLEGCETAVPIHRLDVGTSGLVIFARKAQYLTAWSEALSAADARKIYLAAVRGRTPSKGAVSRDLRDEGKILPARTRFRWLGGIGGHSVVRVIPEQGRTHQIRRHFASIDHPILGDERYGHPPTNRFFEEKHGLDRTFLHCIRIELTHPHTQQRLIVETPIPGDLRLTLLRCGGPAVVKFLEGKSALGGTIPSTLPPPPSAQGSRTSKERSSLSIQPPPSSKESLIPPSIQEDDSLSANEPLDVTSITLNSFRSPIAGIGDE